MTVSQRLSFLICLQIPCSSSAIPLRLLCKFTLMITLQIDVARFLGGGAKYKTVWDRMNPYKAHAKLITAVVNAGQDPSTVEVQDFKPKAQGSDERHFLFALILSPALSMICCFCILFVFPLLICGRHFRQIWG
jgi:hypothetical protein